MAKETPISRVLAGLAGRFAPQGEAPTLRDDERLDGKTCLITGANTGLGKAIAVHLARRGGRVVMACRGGVPEARDDVRRLSGSDKVDILRVDLSDFASIHALCDALKERAEPLDVVVLNAAVVPLKARRTAQGFDLMFGVNYAANVVLLRRLLADGLVAPGRKPRPRLVFVSSEDHRVAGGVDLATFSDFREYSSLGDLSQYGRTKLMFTTYAWELSRRLNAGAPPEEPRVSVFALCPGAVNTDIAREAPAWVKPVLRPTMRFLFRDPMEAAAPAVYFACAEAMEGRTQVYLHLMVEKPPAGGVLDEKFARDLWEATEREIAARDPRRPALVAGLDG